MIEHFSTFCLITNTCMLYYSSAISLYITTSSYHITMFLTGAKVASLGTNVMRTLMNVPFILAFVRTGQFALIFVAHTNALAMLHILDGTAQ
jgi:hypothetical protein